MPSGVPHRTHALSLDDSRAAVVVGSREPLRALPSLASSCEGEKLRGELRPEALPLIKHGI